MMTALEKAKRLEREFSRKPQQLELWGEKVRGMSKTLANSALFAVVDKRTPRRRFEAEVVRSLLDVTIRYTGAQLDQDDHLVFMQLCHLARTEKIGTVVRVTGLAALKGLNWDSSKESYTRLRDSYRRLLEGTVYIHTDSGRQLYGSHLIHSVKANGSADADPSAEWTIILNADMMNLLTGDELTLLDWVRHFKLSGLAKWLHSFYSTHATPLPYKAETIYELCGTKIAEQRIFRSKLKKALDELVSAQFLASYTVGPRPSYLVSVKKPSGEKIVDASKAA
jgi:hypothetical protein